MEYLPTFTTEMTPIQETYTIHGAYRHGKLVATMHYMGNALSALWMELDAIVNGSGHIRELDVQTHSANVRLLRCVCKGS